MVNREKLFDKVIELKMENARLREQLEQVREWAEIEPTGWRYEWQMRREVLAILDQPEDKP